MKIKLSSQHSKGTWRQFTGLARNTVRRRLRKCWSKWLVRSRVWSRDLRISLNYIKSYSRRRLPLLRLSKCETMSSRSSISLRMIAFCATLKWTCTLSTRLSRSRTPTLTGSSSSVQIGSSASFQLTSLMRDAASSLVLTPKRSTLQTWKLSCSAKTWKGTHFCSRWHWMTNASSWMALWI